MYQQIGKKIKTLAVVIAVIGMIFCVIWGLLLIVSDTGFDIVGLLWLLVGPVLCWLGSFVLYGFGELVDKTCWIAEHLETVFPKPQNPAEESWHDVSNETEEAADEIPLQLPLDNTGNK